MAANLCCYQLPCRFSPLLSSSSSSSSSSSIVRRSLTLPFLPPISVSASRQVQADGVDWNDAVDFSSPEQNDSSGLQGFFDKVKLCNRNSEKMCEFIPFVVEGQIVGYVHNRFARNLRSYKDVFTFPEDPSYGGNFGCYISLNSALSAPEERTKAVGDVVKSLGEELIPGFRNELYPVTSSFGTPEYFSLERAAAPYFGIKAYGVHMNGYVQRDGKKYLWVAKRSKVKPTYPGKLDHLVAGGMPHGISCQENLIKECEEEAEIPRSISRKATSVGAVSYMDIDGYRLKRDVLFCYDLELPESFIPENNDGEVESFKLVPVTHAANLIRSTPLFKDNCNLVIIHFLFRHGYIKPDDFGYLKLLQSLTSGNCT